MAETADFNAKKKERDRCIYCGAEGHAAPLACPRIKSVEVDVETGCVCAINFWAPGNEPDLAG